MPLIDSSEHFINTIQSITKYGIFVLNAEGVVISWNDGSAEVQGYSEKEVMGKPFAPLYGIQVHKPPEYFSELLAKSKELGYFEEEGWRQRKDGSYFWSTISIIPIYDEDKKFSAYSIVSRDLTAKKIAGELSEITESALETPILATSNITWRRTSNGEFVCPELQWEHFTGQPWPECQGFGWLKMHPEEEREKVMAFWRGLQKLDLTDLRNNWHAINNPDLVKKLVFKTKLWSKLHKEYRPVITSLIPIFNRDGKFISWMGNEKDEHKLFTERARNQELLEKQQIMLNSAKIGLWEYDKEKDRLDIDANVAKFHGVDLSSFNHGMAEIMAMILPEDIAEFDKKFKACVQHGKPYHMEYRVKCPDGSICHIVGEGIAHHNEHGKINKILGSSWDATATFELMATTARANQAEQQREDQKKFIDTICHELRNPLNGITGHVDVLLEVFADLEKVSGLNEEAKRILEAKRQQLKTSIEVISDCSRHQREVIDQVLDLSKLEKGKTILNKQSFSLQSACRFIVAMHKVDIDTKHLSIKLNLPEEICWVQSDETRFKQLLINILSNAIHYTEKGIISLDLKILNKTEEKTKFTLSIADTGPGFTPEQMDHMFERFTPFTRRSFSQYKGTGLGLAISKELAELLGGSIEVKSIFGHGSTFHLSFEFENGQAPALETEAAPTHTSLVISSLTNNKTVLVVDDSKINRQMLDRIITKLGLKSVHAEDGEQAILAYEQYKPDLIFMDIEMPKKNGYEASSSIRSIESNRRPVIIYAVTGYAGEEHNAKAKVAGMNGVVTKPINAKAIKDIICATLGLTFDAPVSDALFKTESASAVGSAGAAGGRSESASMSFAQMMPKSSNELEMASKP